MKSLYREYKIARDVHLHHFDDPAARTLWEKAHQRWMNLHRYYRVSSFDGIAIHNEVVAELKEA